MNMFFHIKEYDQGRKTYNSGVCVKGSTSNEFEVNYYGKLKEVIELKYHNEQNRVFLFKYYWFDTTNREIKVDLHHGLEKNNTRLDFTTLTMSLFSPSNASNFITQTLFPLERIVLGLIDCLLLKPNLEAMIKLFRMVMMNYLQKMMYFNLMR